MLSVFSEMKRRMEDYSDDGCKNPSKNPFRVDFVRDMLAYGK